MILLSKIDYLLNWHPDLKFLLPNKVTLKNTKEHLISSTLPTTAWGPLGLSKTHVITGSLCQSFPDVVTTGFLVGSTRETLAILDLFIVDSCHVLENLNHRMLLRSKWCKLPCKHIMCIYKCLAYLTWKFNQSMLQLDLVRHRQYESKLTETIGNL